MSAEEGASRFSGSDPGYKYTRLGNPTVHALEEAIRELEGGYSALGTSSGMAAVSTVLLTFLRSGDHVIVSDAVYGPIRLLLERRLDGDHAGRWQESPFDAEKHHREEGQPENRDGDENQA